MWLFGALLVLGSWLPTIREANRIKGQYVAITTLIGFIIAQQAPNPFLGTLIALMCFGVWWTLVPSENLPLTLWPAMIWAIGYVLLAKQVTPEWIEPMLYVVMTLGLMLGFAAIYFVWTKDERLSMWQGNSNYAQGVAAVCTAATVGIADSMTPWAWLAFPLVVYPIFAIDQERWVSSEDHNPTQGVLLLVVLAVAKLWVWHWPSGLVATVLFTTAIGVFLWYRPHALSCRAEIWAHGYKGWARMPWMGRLLGAGTGMWVKIYQYKQPTAALATTAHNEYLQCLVEHGLLGVTLLCGYVGTVLWTSYHGGPLGEPLFLMACVMAACAFISFPWTLYHEAYIVKTNEVYGHGSPTLNVLTLAIMVLAEAL